MPTALASHRHRHRTQHPAITTPKERIASGPSRRRGAPDPVRILRRDRQALASFSFSRRWTRCVRARRIALSCRSVNTQRRQERRQRACASERVTEDSAAQKAQRPCTTRMGRVPAIPERERVEQPSHRRIRARGVDRQAEEQDDRLDRQGLAAGSDDRAQQASALPTGRAVHPRQPIMKARQGSKECVAGRAAAARPAAG